jgi:bacteriocin-like protein
MSDNQNNIGQLHGAEGFKPLSEEEEKAISGGLFKPGRCKDDEYLDPISGLCVKKSSHPTPTTF